MEARMAENVLVVEDQPGWTALVRNALRNGRLPACSIFTAASFDEAERLVRDHRFRVALLDHTLSPSRSGARTGLDVAELLRRVSPQAVLFLITLVDPEHVQARCDQLGVTLIEKGRGDLESVIIQEVREALAAAG
jgi:CheY-like chemotaxis protein